MLPLVRSRWMMIPFLDMDQKKEADAGGTVVQLCSSDRRQVMTCSQDTTMLAASPRFSTKAFRPYSRCKRLQNTPGSEKSTVSPTYGKVKNEEPASSAPAMPRSATIRIVDGVGDALKPHLRILEACAFVQLSSDSSLKAVERRDLVRTLIENPVSLSSLARIRSSRSYDSTSR